MQVLDIIVLIIVAAMTIWGMVRGVVRQIGDLAALVMGIIGANLLGGEVSSWIQNLSGWSSIVSQLIGYLLVFLIIYLGIRIVAQGIKSLAKLVRLGWIDSVGGGLFSAFKTILLLSILVNLALLLTQNATFWYTPTFTQSLCFETLRSFAPHILHLVWG